MCVLAQGCCPEEVWRATRAWILDQRERRAEPGVQASRLAGTGRGLRRAQPEPDVPSIPEADLFLDEVRAAADWVGEGGMGDHQGHLDAVPQAHDLGVHPGFPIETFDPMGQVLEV